MAGVAAEAAAFAGCMTLQGGSRGSGLGELENSGTSPRLAISGVRSPFDRVSQKEL